ncbi:MAG: pyruvate flavodoxin/ferredoxin oxidoreductase [Chloroflexi bacterium]|nr:pyruvate flavodoxin/ferredoxin oxidoreductase [Chloroflexota bacterium]
MEQILKVNGSKANREFINGADAIVRGAIHAECDFFAGYPITPATPILLQMVNELPKVGGVAIQAEDEIAAIGMCIGAAMAGSRVLTATSGPGISLYSENIGMAIMGEVPIVIVDCQRMGPATGGATTTSQGDIQFLRWGTSGGYPVIVLSPTNVVECYNLTRKAFDLSERFRVPVFLATDKETVSTNVTVNTADFEAVPVRERNLAAEGIDFIPYRVGQASDVPDMAVYGGAHILRFTTSSHNEKGYLTKNRDDVGRLNEHLTEKISAHIDEIAMLNTDLQSGADTLIISYGVTARSVTEAVRLARLEGKKVSALTIYSLWPIPERQIREVLDGYKRVLVVELNHGQYLREIERLAKNDQEVIGLSRVDGGLISPSEILEKVGMR